MTSNVTYNNNYTWLIICSKILPKIKELMLEKNKNAHDIINNFEINDLILNTEQFSYYWNFCKNALDNQDKIHEINFNIYITKNELPLIKELFNIDNIDEVKEFFNTQIKKIFTKDIKKLENKFIENDKIFNIKFSPMEDMLSNIQQTYSKYHPKENQNNAKWNELFADQIDDIFEGGSKKLIQQATNKIKNATDHNLMNNNSTAQGMVKARHAFADLDSKVKNSEAIWKDHLEGLSEKKIATIYKQNITGLKIREKLLESLPNTVKGIAIDTAKLIIILNSLKNGQNVLFCDFDTENQNITVDNKTSSFPKMSFISWNNPKFNDHIRQYQQMNLNNQNKLAINYTKQHFPIENNNIDNNQIWYSVHAALLFCPVAIEKGLMAVLDFTLQNADWMLYQGGIGTERILYQFINFLMDLDCKSNDEIKDYFNNIDYDAFYEEFEKYAKDQIENDYYGFEKTKQFLEKHGNTCNKKYHLVDNGEAVMGKLGGSWNNDEFSNEKLNIYEQIDNHCLSFNLNNVTPLLVNIPDPNHMQF